MLHDLRKCLLNLGSQRVSLGHFLQPFLNLIPELSVLERDRHLDGHVDAFRAGIALETMLGDSDPSILYEETRHIFDDGGKGFAEADQRGEDRRKQSVALFNRQN